MSRKVVCAVDGCSYRSHILLPHIIKKHSMTVLEYMERYNASWYSDFGYEKLKEKRGDIAQKLPLLDRAKRTITLGKLFPSFCEEDEDIEETVDVFVEPTKRTPQRLPQFIFPEDQTLEFCTIVAKPQRNNIYISGYSGTGKTTLVHNLAAVYNADWYELTGSSYHTRSDLLGRWVVKGGDMVFQYGKIPKAMRNGAWLLINELDTLDPNTLNVLKPVLEDNPRISIDENGDELIEAHPDFRVIVTSNTWARGDDTGMFVNTETQSIADQRRFHAFIEMDYLDEVTEHKILQGYCPELSERARTYFITVANKVRSAFKAGEICRTFSPAELVNWAENYQLFESAHRAARVSFLRAYEPEVKVAVSEMISNVWGQEDREVIA